LRLIEENFQANPELENKMKIIFDKLEIARGTAFNESPYDLYIKGGKEIQVTQSLRAKTIKTNDRGNFETRISFRVRREHGSAEEAVAYALLHPAEVSRYSGNVMFLPEGDVISSKMLLKEAAVTSVNCNSIGASTYLRYEIVGGELCKMN